MEKFILKTSYTIETDKGAWQGELEIMELTEHHCIAKAKSRGTEFIISLSCYYDAHGIFNWFLGMPDYDFGCRISRSWQINKDVIGKHVKKAVDCQSLTDAVWELLNIIKTTYGRERIV